jgi:hypothetical protein
MTGKSATAKRNSCTAWKERKREVCEKKREESTSLEPPQDPACYFPKDKNNVNSAAHAHPFGERHLGLPADSTLGTLNLNTDTAKTKRGTLT